MSVPDWLFAVVCVAPFAVLPAAWACWHAQVAVRVRWRMRALARDLDL